MVWFSGLSIVPSLQCDYLFFWVLVFKLYVIVKFMEQWLFIICWLKQNLSAVCAVFIPTRILYILFSLLNKISSGIVPDFGLILLVWNWETMFCTRFSLLANFHLQSQGGWKKHIHIHFIRREENRIKILKYYVNVSTYKSDVEVMLTRLDSFSPNFR